MVYLIHLNRKIAHAGHYIGASSNIKRRLITHALGRGSKLLARAFELEIKWKVVRVWKASFELERQIKKMKSGPDYCPICNPGHERMIKNFEEFPINLVMFPVESEILKCIPIQIFKTTKKTKEKHFGKMTKEK